MKRRRRAPAPRTSPRTSSPRTGGPSWHERLAAAALWALVLLPPLILDPQAKDSFRLPKELVSELLVLASLALLSFRLRRAGRIEWRRFFTRPAVLAVLPLFAVVTLGWLATDHPEHVRQGWASFAIGAAALVGWSLALAPDERRRYLVATIAPAALLAVLVILQSHGIFDPFRFEGRVNARRGLTSLAGGALDLGAYLVLPALAAQWALYRSRTTGRRAAWALALALVLYALARTQTLTALAAVALASVVLWAALLPARRLAVVGAVLMLLGLGLAVGVEPLRVRLANRAQLFSEGEFNVMLTGRLDGWRTAVRMLEHHPWLGVGLGAFTTEFAGAKTELTAEGVRFYERHFEPHFASAHNEYLEVAAECGWLGLLALGWGIALVLRELVRSARRAKEREDRERAVADVALMASGAAALFMLALASFPMQLAMVAYPYLLLLSWILGSGDDGEEVKA